MGREFLIYMSERNIISINNCCLFCTSWKTPGQSVWFILSPLFIYSDGMYIFCGPLSLHCWILQIHTQHALILSRVWNIMSCDFHRWWWGRNGSRRTTRLSGAGPLDDETNQHNHERHDQQGKILPKCNVALLLASLLVALLDLLARWPCWASGRGLGWKVLCGRRRRHGCGGFCGRNSGRFSGRLI